MHFILLQLHEVEMLDADFAILLDSPRKRVVRDDFANVFVYEGVAVRGVMKLHRIRCPSALGHLACCPYAKALLLGENDVDLSVLLALKAVRGQTIAMGRGAAQRNAPLIETVMSTPTFARDALDLRESIDAIIAARLVGLLCARYSALTNSEVSKQPTHLGPNDTRNSCCPRAVEKRRAIYSDRCIHPG